MKRLSLCEPIAKGCCGDLFYAPECPICRAAAGLVRLADLRGSITLRPVRGIWSPHFLRTVRGVRTDHYEESLYGEVLAELLGVDRLPLQRVLNDALRLVLNLGRALMAFSHGDRVPWRLVLLLSGHPSRA